MRVASRETHTTRQVVIKKKELQTRKWSAPRTSSSRTVLRAAHLFLILRRRTRCDPFFRLRVSVLCLYTLESPVSHSRLDATCSEAFKVAT